MKTALLTTLLLVSQIVQANCGEDVQVSKQAKTEVRVCRLANSQIGTQQRVVVAFRCMNNDDPSYYTSYDVSNWSSCLPKYR